MDFEKIFGLLGPADRARLRLANRPPTLALYRIAHEGVSGGAVVGLGKTPKRWTRARIEELASSMDAENAPVYRGHPNGAGMRFPIGRVIKCFTDERDGNVEALAVVHLTEHKSAEEALMKKLDAASIEADLSLEPSSDGWVVARVERVTGLALEERNGANPGFPRAGLIAAVRESLDAGNDNTSDAPRDREDAPNRYPAANMQDTIEETMKGKNLSHSERDYIHRRVRARVSPESGEEHIRYEANLSIDDLDEAKRLYRRPPAHPAAPAERKRGPVNYTNPEYNELIPR